MCDEWLRRCCRRKVCQMVVNVTKCWHELYRHDLNIVLLIVGERMERGSRHTKE